MSRSPRNKPKNAWEDARITGVRVWLLEVQDEAGGNLSHDKRKMIHIASWQEREEGEKWKYKKVTKIQKKFEQKKRKWFSSCIYSEAKTLNCTVAIYSYFWCYLTYFKLLISFYIRGHRKRPVARDGLKRQKISLLLVLKSHRKNAESIMAAIFQLISWKLPCHY